MTLRGSQCGSVDDSFYCRWIKLTLRQIIPFVALAQITHFLFSLLFLLFIHCPFAVFSLRLWSSLWWKFYETRFLSEVYNSTVLFIPFLCLLSSPDKKRSEVVHYKSQHRQQVTRLSSRPWWRQNRRFRRAWPFEAQIVRLHYTEGSVPTHTQTPLHSEHTFKSLFGDFGGHPVLSFSKLAGWIPSSLGTVDVFMFTSG